MKNKILTTLLTFTFLLGACQEMPWKIKEEQEKYAELQQGCRVLVLICVAQADNSESAITNCNYQYMTCTGNFF